MFRTLVADITTLSCMLVLTASPSRFIPSIVVQPCMYTPLQTASRSSEETRRSRPSFSRDESYMSHRHLSADLARGEGRGSLTYTVHARDHVTSHGHVIGAVTLIRRL